MVKRCPPSAEAMLAFDALPLLAVAVVAGALSACATIADVEPIEYQSTGNDAASDDVPDRDATADAATTPDAPSCDTDGDGDGVPSEACGGADCDDTDPRVNPNADFVDEPPPAGKNGDWNCDGVVTKQFDENLDCSTFTPDECPTHVGFVTKAACGELFNSVACYVSQGACIAKVEGLRKQGCK